jgi:hypothetical protein
MPYNAAQTRLMMAAAHDKGIAKKSGMSQHAAKKMLKETTHKQRSKAMQGPVKRSILS